MAFTTYCWRCFHDGQNNCFEPIRFSALPKEFMLSDGWIKFVPSLKVLPCALCLRCASCLLLTFVCACGALAYLFC